MKISSLFLSVVTAFILLLGNEAFAVADIYFVHNDHLGTPQVLTNQEQNVVWQGDYKPFGEVDISINNVELDARFPGQYQDSETGVYYNYFRDYDPSLGRYIQSDPIGILRDYSDPQLQLAIESGVIDETGFANETLNHIYNYVGQNPFYWIDPYGLAEHTTNKRRSNREKHENANSRRDRDRGGEKADKDRRDPRKRPNNHKGPWPLRTPFLPFLNLCLLDPGLPGCPNACAFDPLAPGCIPDC